MKQKVDKNKKNVNQELEIGNLFKIILIILVVFGAFYILTYYMQKGKTNTPNNNSNNTIPIIQYDEILMGSILNQNENEYYVLIVKKEDYTKRYKNYLNSYSKGNKFYYSLIDNGMNSNYISDESNLNVENIRDLRVTGTSLLKINDGKITESYDGNSAVMQKIIDMNK